MVSLGQSGQQTSGRTVGRGEGGREREVLAGLRNVLPFPSSGFWAGHTEVKFRSLGIGSLRAGRGKPATSGTRRRNPPGPSVFPAEGNGPHEPFCKQHPPKASGAAALCPPGVRQQPPPLHRLRVAARRAGATPRHAPAQSPSPPLLSPPRGSQSSPPAGQGRAPAGWTEPRPGFLYLGPENGECTGAAGAGAGQRGRAVQG